MKLKFYCFSCFRTTKILNGRENEKLDLIYLTAIEKLERSNKQETMCLLTTAAMLQIKNVLDK